MSTATDICLSAHQPRRGDSRCPAIMPRRSRGRRLTRPVPSLIACALSLVVALAPRPAAATGLHTETGTQRSTAVENAATAAATAGAPSRIVPGTAGRALPAPPAVEPSITVAILPDRTTGREWGIPYLRQVVEDLNIIAPDAVFTVGDMVQGYTRSMDHYTAEVDEYLSITSNLRAPFYPLPGNHDVISGMRDPSDRRFEQEYQNRFGPLYFAAFLDHVSVLCLYTDEQLDSEPRLSDKQVEWATEQVREAEQRGNPLLVLMHKPVWRYRNANWDTTMHPVLARAVERGLRVITIAGHFHSLQRDADRDGVEYHLVGTCGGMIDQHPLGGQLQHFTIVKITESGATNVYHQPVGVTFPPDFIVTEDQNRVHRLKSQGDRFAIASPLDQPFGKPVEGTVRINLQNPIDRPITIRGGLLLDQPGPSIVAGTALVGRTEVDIFNPFVSRIDTPFRPTRETNGEVTLQPNERGVYEIPIAAPAQPTLIAPPQLHLLVTFEDTKGRTVPVVIRRRVPLRAEYPLVRESSELPSEAVAAMPISAWDYSVYDLRERDPEVKVRQVGNHVEVAVTTFDDNLSYESLEALPDRLENPLSDTVVVRIGSGAGAVSYLVEPFSWRSAETVWKAVAAEPSSGANGGGRGNGGNQPQWTLTAADDVEARVFRMMPGYRVKMRIPVSVFGKPGDRVPFNVLVADNDETYHTQWRSWSQEDAGSVIVLPGE